MYFNIFIIHFNLEINVRGLGDNHQTRNSDHPRK